MKIRCFVCGYEPYILTNGEFIGLYWICEQCLMKLFSMIRDHKNEPEEEPEKKCEVCGYDPFKLLIIKTTFLKFDTKPILTPNFCPKCGKNLQKEE